VAVDQLLKTKINSPRYHGWLTYTLREFSTKYADRKPSEVTPEELREFIWAKKSIAESTRHNTYRALSRFYRFVVQHKWLAEFPMDERHVPVVEDKVPSILRVADAEQLMRAAQVHYPDMIVFMALALFAGVRIEELCKLELKDIVYNTADDQFMLLVGPHVGKKRRARNIRLPANCQLWIQDRLEPRTPSRYVRKEHCGRILPGEPGGVHYRVRLIAEKAEVTMSQNVMRHSFASYYYELTGDAEKTRARLGHDTPEVLFTHYAALVLRNAVNNPFDYFKITPYVPADPQWIDQWIAYLGPKGKRLSDINTANPASLQVLNLT
jgi:site-specific recombinase XerD